MKITKPALNTTNHKIEHHIHIVEGTKIGDITLPNWFKITKSQLTDLVQVGSFILDKIDLTITIDMVETYQEVHVWKSVQRQNNPQGLKDFTAQEALSYTTGIQIMDDTMGSFDENGDALEFAMAMTQEDVNAQLEIECSAGLDMQMANESI